MEHVHNDTGIRDMHRINEYLAEMANCAETSLRDTLEAFLENNHTLAYGIILRDGFIDDKEKEIDRLCFEFLLQRQPVTLGLRFAVSAMKINLEIERVGDYAESMARQILKLKNRPSQESINCIIELAELATTMFHDAIQAFINQSVETAQKTIAVEEKVDALRNECIKKLLETPQEGVPPLPLLNIIRRFERVADQARNICMEVLFLCTGENRKHPGAEVIRILFVDNHHSIHSRIAEAAGDGLNLEGFLFSSAGIDPEPLDEHLVDRIRKNGHPFSLKPSLALSKVPNLEYYHVIVGLSPEVRKTIPRQPSKTIYLDWEITSPPLETSDDGRFEASIKEVSTFITDNVSSLANAIACSSG